jgi:hypothetical protein
MAGARPTLNVDAVGGPERPRDCRRSPPTALTRPGRRFTGFRFVGAYGKLRAMNTQGTERADGRGIVGHAMAAPGEERDPAP